MHTLHKALKNFNDSSNKIEKQLHVHVETYLVDYRLFIPCAAFVFRHQRVLDSRVLKPGHVY